jgi:hypothetical protein
MIKHKEVYNEARRAFDGLKIEEQAIFLVESAMAMVAQGIEQFGSMMARQFEDEPASEGAGTAGAEEGTKKSAATGKTRRTSPRKPRPTKPNPDASA